MGKKHNKQNKQNKFKNEKYPFVSVCTPTYNRRPFIASMIKCFEHQDYPKEKLEWIIIDDGTDKIEDLVSHIPQVKYFKYDEKMPLGKKRNLMHSKSKGEIFVYMDDDDYYPPDRISHAVKKLLSIPEVLCAGSSELYIWFKHINQMYKFGPYGPNHATAGTFAFKRKLIENNKYDDDACLAEEKNFLQNYTVPFIQLDPMKTILVFSHEHNTFDKRELLKIPNPQFVNISHKTVDMFVKDAQLKDFFINKMDKLLLEYEPGDPKNKPDVLKQLKEIKQSRQDEMNKKNQEFFNTEICLENNQGDTQKMSIKQMIEQLQKQHNQLCQLDQILQSRDREIAGLKQEIENYKNKENVIELEKFMDVSSK